MLLGPFDAGRHENLRKAGLVDADGVFDDGEVDEGDLEDVVREVAFEYACSIRPLVLMVYSREYSDLPGHDVNIP